MKLELYNTSLNFINAVIFLILKLSL